MKNSVRVSAVLALLVALPLVGGCGGSALSFNNNLAKANQRLANSAKTFGENLGKILKGGGDPKTLESSYKDVDNTLEAIKKEITEYKIEGIDGAKELRDAYLVFLKGQEQIVKVEFKEAMDVVKNTSLQPFDKENRVGNIMQRISQVEARDLVGLQAAQRAFAGKHNMKLK